MQAKNKQACSTMCREHTVASLLLFTEEGGEEGVQINGTVHPGVILVAVISCKLSISSTYDVPPANSCQPSSDHGGVILAAVISCKLKISRVCDVPPVYRRQPSSVHR